MSGPGGIHRDIEVSNNNNGDAAHSPAAHRHTALLFPSFPPGTSAPPGNFLDPRSYSAEASPSYVTRSGFPNLASSFHFVEAASTGAEALLDEFVQAWSSTVEAALAQAEPGSPLPAPSPFAVFKGVYTRRGWNLFQLYWSEHHDTRSNIYLTFVRVFTDRLRSLLPLLSTTENGHVCVDDTLAKDLSSTEALKAVGVLFGLKLLQSTTALVAADVAASRPSARLPIEADIYHVLLALPVLAESYLAQPEGRFAPGLQPMDDVVFLLRDMSGDATTSGEATSDEELSEASSDGEGQAPRPRAGRESVFEVLPPTAYGARPAMVSNVLSTRAERERRGGIWGQVRSTGEEGNTSGMSRAELMHNMLRERLKLPVCDPSGAPYMDSAANVSSTSQGMRPDLVMEPAKVEKRGQTKGRERIALPPSREAEEALQECLGRVAACKHRYDGSKKQRLGDASLLPTQYDTQGQTAYPSTTKGILALARQRAVRAIRSSIANDCASEQG